MITLEEKDNRFYVDYSTIPNANKGLFAKEKIYKGDIIEIIGVYVKKFGISASCIEYTSRYRYKFQDYYVVPVGVAAMINFTPSKEEANVIAVSTDRTYLEVTKQIEPDEEVFLYGGPEIQTVLEKYYELENKIETITKEENNFFLNHFEKFSFLTNE